MYRNAFALTLVLAFTAFAPSAQAAYLCEDDDGEVAICSNKIIIPSVPVVPMPSMSDRLERELEKIEDAKERMLDRACIVLPDACD